MSASTHLLPAKRLWLNAVASGAPQPHAALAAQGLAASESGKVRTWIVVVLVVLLLLSTVLVVRRGLRAVEARLLYQTRKDASFADVFRNGNAAALVHMGVKSYTVPMLPAETAAPLSHKPVGVSAPVMLRYLALVPPSAQCEGSVVLLHGNASTAEDVMCLFGRRLSHMNLAVFALEYPGYAGDPNKPSEAALLEHAVRLLDHVTTTGHAVPHKPLIVVGHSLGGAVAVHVASKRPDLVHAALLIGPISSVCDVVSARVPYVPFRWFVHDNFDACAWARLVICPVTVLRGTDDVIVPPHVSARLAACFPVPPCLVDLQGASHNDVFATHEDEVWRAFERCVSDAGHFRNVRQ